MNIKLVKTHKSFKHNRASLSLSRLFRKYKTDKYDKQIEQLISEIDALYWANTSHMQADGINEIAFVVYPLEKLVIHIESRKQDLKRLERKRNRSLSLLEKAMKDFSNQERQDVYDFIQSDGVTRYPKRLNSVRNYIYKVEKLRKDRLQNTGNYYAELERQQKVKEMREEIQALYNR